MAIPVEHTAVLIIDMQNGFIEPESALSIAGAEATLPNCAKVLRQARELNMPVYYVRREYARDGSNVEAVRYEAWLKGGKPLSAASEMTGSLDFPESIAPHSTDRIITKPRFSAFFGTGLHGELQQDHINTVLLLGTTTPNCIRTTCYDALSLNYNVVVIEDATSSRTPKVQDANIEDMRHLNVQILDTATFCESGLQTAQDLEAEFYRARGQ